MKRWLLWVVVGSTVGASLPGRAGSVEPLDAVIERYVEAWKGFYPSRAVSLGLLDAIDGFEDRSGEAVDEWIELNRGVEAALADLDGRPRDDAIDGRLLRAQARREIERWVRDRPHQTSPGLYADLIAGAFEPLGSPRLSAAERHRLTRARLEQVALLARAAAAQLADGRPAETRRAIERLEREDECPGGPEAAPCREAVAALVATLRDDLLPRLTLPDEPILGRDAYARKLALYTDSDLTPERLEQIALREIEESKRLLAELAARHWREVDPQMPVPADFDTLVDRAFAAVEANRPENEAEYLLELRRYGQEVETFVREGEIATVPEHRTLSLELAPESAGPMARIGYVSSAPTFHPNPWTTWYLATIPDTYPERERLDFWSSFNYSFKRFIVIHELFPGHYMQLKLLRENPHVVRRLFPYRPFIEGWATFAERIVLDAGYAEGDLLTRLAQLRKRLENANRAYTSVQAHCDGWSEERVFDFSVETSLLAPQFAKSLWGRLMRSPMQITTYMHGGLELRAVYEAERERLGEAFETRAFMDTVLRTGPVPSDEIAAMLAEERP